MPMNLQFKACTPEGSTNEIQNYLYCLDSNSTLLFSEPFFEQQLSQLNFYLRMVRRLVLCIHFYRRNHVLYFCIRLVLCTHFFLCMIDWPI